MEQNNKKKFNKSDIEIWRWIYSICKSERLKVVVIIAANVVSAVLTIAFANFSKNLINAATEEHSMKRVIYFALCYFAVVAVQMFITLLGKSMSERCKGKLEWELKQHMLKVIMKKTIQASQNTIRASCKTECLTMSLSFQTDLQQFCRMCSICL